MRRASVAGRRPAFSLHRRNCRLPSIREAVAEGIRSLCRAGYRTDRPHDSVAGFGFGVSPRSVPSVRVKCPNRLRTCCLDLRDPDFTRVLIVTLPEATPVHEAAKLQEDLRRAEIEPFAWVINQSLTPLSVTDPRLQSREATRSCHLSAKCSDSAALGAWR